MEQERTERNAYEPDRALADLDTLALRERVREAIDAIKVEREKITDRIESRREWPDEFHVLDGKQLGFFHALQILERICPAALTDHREGEE